MLEAHAHQQLKALLQREGGGHWPHHLSLSRLVARRGEHRRNFISLNNLASLDGPNLPGLGDTQVTNGHLGEGF